MARIYHFMSISFPITPWVDGFYSLKKKKKVRFISQFSWLADESQ